MEDSPLEGLGGLASRILPIALNGGREDSPLEALGGFASHVLPITTGALR